MLIHQSPQGYLKEGQIFYEYDLAYCYNCGHCQAGLPAWCPCDPKRNRKQFYSNINKIYFKLWIPQTLHHMHKYCMISKNDSCICLIRSYVLIHWIYPRFGRQCKSHLMTPRKLCVNLYYIICRFQPLSQKYASSYSALENLCVPSGITGNLPICFLSETTLALDEKSYA